MRLTSLCIHLSIRKLFEESASKTVDKLIRTLNSQMPNTINPASTPSSKSIQSAAHTTIFKGYQRTELEATMNKPYHVDPRVDRGLRTVSHRSRLSCGRICHPQHPLDIDRMRGMSMRQACKTYKQRKGHCKCISQYYS